MSLSPRFNGLKNQENSDRGVQNDYLAPVYAASIALVIKGNAAKTLVNIGPMTGPLALSVNVGAAGTPPYVGDTIAMLLASDGTTRTVTFGAGFAASLATFAVTTAKYGFIEFVFNGIAWVETSRVITA